MLVDKHNRECGIVIDVSQVDETVAARFFGENEVGNFCKAHSAAGDETILFRTITPVRGKHDKDGTITVSYDLNKTNVAIAVAQLKFLSLLTFLEGACEMGYKVNLVGHINGRLTVDGECYNRSDIRNLGIG